MTQLALSWIVFILCCGMVASQSRPRDVNEGQVPNQIYYNGAVNITQGSQLERNMETVLEFLFRVTVPNGYATCIGYDDIPNTVFAHTACYNLSDRTSCFDCLRIANISIHEQTRARPLGAAYWARDSGCNLRYETYNFTVPLPLDTLGVLGPNFSVTPTPAPDLSTPFSLTNESTTGLGINTNNKAIVGIVVGSVLGAFFILCIAIIFVKRLKKPQNLKGPTDELQGATKGPCVFSYKELCSAAKNFSTENKLGEGGFGPVYKGVFGNGNWLAVKKLSVGSQQGKREFVNEINIITGIQHRNLVKLIGYCAEGENRLLAYEFLENGSLDRALFENHHGTSLDWPSRVQIVIGVAKGIAYLHEESHVQIIHRDIKASNILLDKNLQPKISDFGISKLEDAMTTSDTMSTRVAGTLGYMAPEYVTRGRLSTKADVFSFGVLVLEIISGRKCMDPTLSAEEEILLQKTWILYKAGKLEELLDARLGRNYVPDEAYRMVHVAMLCAQEFEGSRPTMSEVVAMFMGFLEMPPLSTDEAPSFFNLLAQHVQQGWTSNSSNTGTRAWDQSSSITSLHAR